MANKHVFILFALTLSMACAEGSHITKIEGERIEINDTIVADSAVDAFIRPYRLNINKSLDSVISYALETYSKKDGELNTALGNLMADAVFSQGNPVFNKRTGKDISFVLLNFDGIRSIISQGKVSLRTAYEVMPFENSIVIVALKGERLEIMLDYLSRSKSAHPISEQLEVVLNRDFELKSATIRGEPIDPNCTYYVATSDYLYNGGDSMVFFQPNDSLYDINYKIRNVLIDYFKKTDTLRPKKDKRFIRNDP